MNVLGPKDDTTLPSADMRVNPHHVPDGYEDEASLEILPIVNFLLRERYRILKPTAWVALLVLAFTLTRPAEYTATAKFVVAAAPDSSIALPGNGVTPEGNAGSIADTMPEYYEALLNSDDFLKGVIYDEVARLKSGGASNWLQVLGGIPVDGGEQLDDMIVALNDTLTIKSVKSSQPRSATTMLALSAKLPKQEAAEDLANVVLNGLSQYGGLHRNEKAVQDRDFIQSRLQDTEAELKRSEAELAEFSMRNRKIVTADLEAQKERLERAVKVQEELFLTLRKQLEMAKIKVQENQTLIQVIENPDAKRTGPKRVLMVALSSVLALFFFSGLAYVRYRWQQMDRSDGDIQELLGNLHSIRSDLSVFVRRLRGQRLRS